VGDRPEGTHFGWAGLAEGSGTGDSVRSVALRAPTAGLPRSCADTERACSLSARPALDRLHGTKNAFYAGGWVENRPAAIDAMASMARR
jgi:hypothetical protein